MERSDKNIIAVVVIVFVVISIAFWVSGSSDSSTTTQIDTDEGFMQVFHDNYIQGCKLEGGTEGYCSCTYDYLDRNLSDEELVDMAVVFAQGNEVPDVFYEAVSSCADKF